MDDDAPVVDAVYEWRRERLVALGFTAPMAEALADTTADLHEIARALGGGCSLDVAFLIFS